MSVGLEAMNAFIARVEALRQMNEQVAKQAEAGVADAARKTAAASETPTGEAWPALKDGGKALRGAAGAIKSSTKGNRITLQIGEPWVFHNWGAGGSSTTKKAEQSRRRTARHAEKSGKASKFHAPRRQILASSGEPIPKAINDAVKEAADAVFEKAMGG